MGNNRCIEDFSMMLLLHSHHSTILCVVLVCVLCVAGHSTFKRLGLISRNPGKSKHFEVAAVRVGGIAIDLVNLIPPAGRQP